MTASIIQFRSGGGLSVSKVTPHRAPIATPRPPDWRSAHDFTFPIFGALCGAGWFVLLASIIGVHLWMILPVAFGCAIGLLFIRVNN